MNLINPEVRELEEQFSGVRDRMSKIEGQVEELRRINVEVSRNTIWQFIVFTMTMAAVVIGGIKYQTDALRNEFNARFEAVEKRIEQSEKSVNLRLEQSERNLNARFEDLRQTVLSQRKQTGEKESPQK